MSSEGIDPESRQMWDELYREQAFSIETALDEQPDYPMQPWADMFARMRKIIRPEITDAELADELESEAEMMVVDQPGLEGSPLQAAFRTKAVRLRGGYDG